MKVSFSRICEYIRMPLMGKFVVHGAICYLLAVSWIGYWSGSRTTGLGVFALKEKYLTMLKLLTKMTHPLHVKKRERLLQGAMCQLIIGE